ncbi:MAG: hypothetical protein K8R92_08355 [Planctomycetes bacterium]|nr:hypothetical protein [Planctomycetota bacterium]
MSGICGLIDFGAGLEGDALRSLMSQMQQAMIHRGFERDTYWIDPQARIALSDCHLLSSRKPASSDSDQSIHIVYDGDELESSGTNAILPGDLPDSLRELVKTFSNPTKSPIAALRGIESPFALALWNDRLKKLLLARDAFDARPLYFASGRGWFAFASELRALRSMPELGAALDAKSIGDYLSSGGVRGTHTIHREASKVGAGCFVELDCAPLFASASVISIRASDPGSIGSATLLAPTCSELNSSAFRNDNPNGDPRLQDLALAEQVELLRRALLESLHGSDLSSGGAHVMPTGTLADFLIAAMCRAELALPTHTYGLSSAADAESAALAHDVARQIGATHRTCEPLEDLSEMLSRIAASLDEPLAASEVVSLNTIAPFIRMSSPRAVSGAGATDLFAGEEWDGTHTQGQASWFASLRALLRSRDEAEPVTESVAPPSYWTPADLLAAGVGASRGAISNEPRPRSETSNVAQGRRSLRTTAIPLLNQVCMHHSLAVTTPFLCNRVARLGVHGVMPQPHGGNGGALVHLLRRYLPESMIQRIAARNRSSIPPRLEEALMDLSEAALFEPESRVLTLTNRIGLRGLLAAPAATPRQTVDRRWSLLLLEYWLRRQPELAPA